MKGLEGRESWGVRGLERGGRARDVSFKLAGLVGGMPHPRRVKSGGIAPRHSVLY